MTGAVAAAQVRAALLVLGVDSAGLNGAGFGGVRLGTRTVTFKYLAAEQALVVRAHLYRFVQVPAPSVLERLTLAARALAEEGVALAYVAPERLLCLEWRSTHGPGGAALASRVRALAVAGVRFAQEHL